MADVIEEDKELQDSFIERINEVLRDFEYIEDFHVEDTDNPDVVDITIRGKLKENLGREEKEEDSATSDYDRAMKGISGVNPCDTKLPITSSDN